MKKQRVLELAALWIIFEHHIRKLKVTAAKSVVSVLSGRNREFPKRALMLLQKILYERLKI